MGFSGASQAGFQKLYSTPVAGFPLQNATPTLFSWQVPNDESLRVVVSYTNKIVSSAETGGTIVLQFNDMNGTLRNAIIDPGGRGTGFFQDSEVVYPQPGSVVSLKQTSALTLGASSLWAELRAG